MISWTVLTIRPSIDREVAIGVVPDDPTGGRQPDPKIWRYENGGTRGRHKGRSENVLLSFDISTIDKRLGSC